MRRAPATALAALATASLTVGCGGSRPAPVTAPPSITTIQVTPSSTTTTDPGLLPQTEDRPSADDPRVQAEARALFEAVVSGDPSAGMDAFFPLSAYRQVKAIRDPAADWRDRLVAAYDRNIETLHARLGADTRSATFVSLDIPNAATWVRPGEEYNKIGYWRVYGSQLRYRVNTELRSFAVFSLIAWRGRWYVVHLHSVTG